MDFLKIFFWLQTYERKVSLSVWGLQLSGRTLARGTHVALGSIPSHCKEEKSLLSSISRGKWQVSFLLT